MRSIRRSLLGYLLVLVALALGAVGLLVDRIAGTALQDRDAAEVDRIGEAFAAREKEALAKFDADLLAEARTLAVEMQGRLLQAAGINRGPARPADPPPRPGDLLRPADSPFRPADATVAEFARRAAAFSLVAPAPAWPAAVAAGYTPRTALLAWSGLEAPQAFARFQIPEVMRKEFVEDDHPGYFQFDVAVEYPGHPARRVAAVHPPRTGGAWSSAPDLTDRSEPEFRYSDVEVPDRGPFRRVEIAAGPRGRPLSFPVWLPPPPGVPPGPPVRRPPDFAVRMHVHVARPYSELADRLASDREVRDDQLAQVRAETRAEVALVRRRLWLIGGVAFAALVVGGLAIVARGLAPLQKLSHAVSQVSEKDFRLPLGPDGLSRELAPIHERMTNTLDQLRRAFAREKQAVADISHELRTPIASLLATIDVSLRRPRSPDQYRNTLEDCRAIAKQLGQLVERIMTLASLDAGTARVAAARADGASVAAECATLIRPLAEAHDLAFALDAPDPVPLETDPDRLREVLVNLLHNAVEYNRPGGSIGLAVRRDGGRAVFEVVDTGIGMTPEVRERIFERFYRADPSRHATGVHAGLGLAIVKEYVDRLGGTIAVESVPGHGTTFRVTLPAAPAPEPAPPARREPAAARS